jgi:hypothetical protein
MNNPFLRRLSVVLLFVAVAVPPVTLAAGLIIGLLRASAQA